MRDVNPRGVNVAFRLSDFTNDASRITVDGFSSALGNSGEAVWIQQGDGSSIDGEDTLVAKDAQQPNGGFNGNTGHLGHFFPFERESHPDMIVIFFAESVAEFQQQAS